MTEKLAKVMAEEMLKSLEGFSGEPYLCPAGELTIGYGHKIKEDEAFKRMSNQEAEVLLREDIDDVWSLLKDTIEEKVFNGLGVNQLAALISFVYNIGEGNWRKSTLLKKLNSGAGLKELALELERWVYVNGRKNWGLIKRRRTEKELFLSGANNAL